MKILAIADVESKALWDYYRRGKLDGIDLILSCGDLDAKYLEFLVTMGNIPVCYVPGNHDDKHGIYAPEGCDPLDGAVCTVNGLRIMGLGGSMRYRDGKYMYTESEMRRRLRRIKRQIAAAGGVDILVTHAPPKGYGDLEDLPHQGFDCFNELLEKVQPRYLLHGHIHAEYGSFQRERTHPSGTQIINCYDRYILDYDEQQPVCTSRHEMRKRLWGAFR